MSDSKFSDAKLLAKAVDYVTSSGEASASGRFTGEELGYMTQDLLPRLEQAVDMEEQGGALTPYREPARVDDDPALAWVDVAEEIQDRRAASAEDLWRAAKQGYAALRDRLTEAQQKLRDLEDVQRILDENERLKAELALAGPPDAQAQLESMANKLGSAQGEIKALEIQLSALKTALANERLASDAKDRAFESQLKASVSEQLPGLKAASLASDIKCVRCKGPISNEDVDQGWRKCAKCRQEEPPMLPPGEW